MSSMSVTFTTLGLMVVMFMWGRVPTAVVALGTTLLLYGAGVLSLEQALAGFGNITVLFIAALFVVSAGLNAGGVTSWVGRVLVRHGQQSRIRLLALTMLLVGVLTALIGVSGASAALLPVVILVAVRLGRPPGQLLMPMAFAGHAGSMLVLTGSLVNVVISNALTTLGEPRLGYFEVTTIGMPLLAGTIGLVVLLSDALLPARKGRAIPEDLSRHSGTLAEQYSLFEGLCQLAIAPGSPYVGMWKEQLRLANHPHLSLIAIQTRNRHGPVDRSILAVGDVLILRGEPSDIDRFGQEKGLVRRDEAAATEMREALFNATAGFAEVMVPPRSKLIGRIVFSGMVTESGDLIILAVQRRGATLPPGEVTLEAGDTLLLQGSWTALEDLLDDPDVLVVHSPDLVRSHASTLGAGAKRATAILAVMVVLLATGAVPPVVAGLGAALAMVVFDVQKIGKAFDAINGTALIMIASLTPLATAMYQTGAAQLMADTLVDFVSGRSSYALLAALFAMTALLGQLISSTATALIVIPIATVAAAEIGVSPRTALVTVAVGAASSFLTPVASSANLMVQGPGGYRFGDYWRLGLPLMLWFFVVGVFLVPVLWPF